MWRRLLSSHLKTLATTTTTTSSSSSSIRSLSTIAKPSFLATTSYRPSSYLLSHHFSTQSDVSKPTKSVEDVMPIATGHEREELEAELQVEKNILEIDYPVGPFGTKENPAIVKSYYDKRIVGCPGGEGEDEHDVVWFWLKKDEPKECPVCSQYFKLEVVGPGGDPEAGHGEDEHH